MSATIKDVARLAGVSISTASIALSGKGPVSPKTQQRVLEAAKKLRYRPNALARSLATSQSQTVGLILPDIRDPYFHDIASGVESVAWERGYTLLFANTNRQLKKERASIETFRSQRVDGIVIAGSGREDEFGDLTETENDVPIVVLGRHHAPLPSVRVDNVAAGRIATEHLLESGRRRIACIGGPEELTTSVDRLTGFNEALRRFGMPLDFAYMTQADFTPEGGRRAMLELLSRLKERQAPLPDAVFVANDQMALGALQALRAEGIRVPDEIAVIGVGDIPMATYVEPPLTTVSLPLRDMGMKAMHLLFELMEGGDPPQEPVILPVELVRRASA